MVDKMWGIGPSLGRYSACVVHMEQQNKVIATSRSPPLWMRVKTSGNSNKSGPKNVICLLYPNGGSSFSARPIRTTLTSVGASRSAFKKSGRSS